MLILNLALPLITLAQWEPDTRLTESPEASSTTGNSIASTGDIIHMAWVDNRDGANGEIYYKASGDGGLNWSPDIRMTNNSALSYGPAICVSGPDVHLVWTDDRNSNFEIYYKRSTNGGFSWSEDTRLTNNGDYSFDPSITATGLIVHLTWTDDRNGNDEIYYKASGDGGVNWSPDARLTNASSLSDNADICVSGPDVHIVWEDYREGSYEIYYKKSTNGGFSWGPDAKLSDETVHSYSPSITATGDIIDIVWYDIRHGAGEIYYIASGDAGLNWSPNVRLTNAPGDSRYPVTFVDGPYVHVVWQDFRSGNAEIYHKLSLNGGFTWGADLRLTINEGYSSTPALSVSDSKAHVIWSDNRDGNSEIYYKRNPTIVGITNINTELPDKFSLQQNFPNPFNPTTKIQFTVEGGKVRLTVFDALGRNVETFVNDELNPGTYEVEFDGSSLESGIYFYTLEINAEKGSGLRETRKMILLK